MPKSTMTFLLLLSISLLTACNIQPANEQNISTTETSQQATLTPLVAPTLLEGNVIADNRIGFTFTYPEDWYNTGGNTPPEGLAYSYSVQSIEPGVGGGGFPDGESKIDLTVVANETYDSLEAVLQNFTNQISSQEGAQITTTEYFTLDSGIEALLIRGEGRMGEFARIFLLINGYQIGISNIGEERFLFQIANSIRPI